MISISLDLLAQDLERRVQEGETVVKGGTGGKSLEAQLHLAEGKLVESLFTRCFSFEAQKVNFIFKSAGRHKGGKSGGEARAEQMGREGYQEMGRKGGLSTMEKSGEEAAKEKGVEIDESKYRTK